MNAARKDKNPLLCFKEFEEEREHEHDHHLNSDSDNSPDGSLSIGESSTTAGHVDWEDVVEVIKRSIEQCAKYQKKPDIPI